MICLTCLLLFAEAVFVVQKFETIKDMLHRDQWICKVLKKSKKNQVISNWKWLAKKKSLNWLAYVFVHGGHCLVFFKFKSYNYK